MYITFEDLREILITDQSSENPGIFIQHMGEVYEPSEIYIDGDGDVVICI